MEKISLKLLLNIINDLEPFLEDCYERINVRKYAKILGILQ